jgi:LysM repeat protein
MSHKTFAQVPVLVLILLVSLIVPISVQAGGVCGGTYIVEAGQTLDSIAATCGTTVAAITAANPGISGSLYAGQSLTVPGIIYTAPVTPVPVTPVPITYPLDTSTNTYNYYNYYGYAPVPYNGMYVVQYGDTFSGIAYRYGVSVNALWAANPYIWNINYLYAGQVIYVPGSSGSTTGYAQAEDSVPLSYGTVPAGTSYGKVKLSNRANGDVYVSLQGTLRDGSSVINEYPVDGGLTVKVPSGWYTYVAWIGGEKFTGGFNLGKGSDASITFFSNRVVVE